jgi:hypothetical protein
MATRKLRITSSKEVFKGTNNQGNAYTIYEVEAVDANTGMMVNVPLRSFDYLVEGETADFEVAPYERPGKPTTYTLKKPRSGGGGGGNALGPKVDALRERVDLLEGNMDIMRRAVSALEHQIQQGQIAHPVTAGGAGGAAPPLAGPPSRPDDDIPF